MIKLLKPYLIFLLIVCYAHTTKAQYSTTALWTSVKTGVEVFDDVDVELATGIRANENLTVLSKIFIEPTVSYRINKHFDIEAEYRFAFDRNFPLWENKHRFAGSFESDFDIERLKISNRLKYQTTQTYPYSGEKDKIAEPYLRYKIKLDYNIRKNPLDPYLAYEFFYYAGNMEYNEIDKYRITVGFDYKYNKNNNFDFEYIMQNSFRGKNAGITHIISIDYKFDW